MHWEIEIVYFSLDKLIFNDSFGSFQLRQLIVDHKKLKKIFMLTILKVILMTAYRTWKIMVNEVVK